MVRWWRVFAGRHPGPALPLLPLLGFDVVADIARLLSPETFGHRGWYAAFVALYVVRVGVLVATVVAPRVTVRHFVTIAMLLTAGLLVNAAGLGDLGAARTGVTVIVALCALVSLYAPLRELVGFLAVAAAGVIVVVVIVSSAPSPVFAVTQSVYAVLSCVVPAGLLFVLRVRLGRATTAAREQSRVDPLTGALNRRGLEERLVEVTARAWREGVAIWLLIVDLDHFKRVNDELGHLVGDEVLVLASSGVREAIRSGDVLARAGGEEFIVVATGDVDRGAGEYADRVRLAVAEAASRYRVTASVGAAVTDPPPQGALTRDWVDAAIGRADVALYEAKEGGRDRVVVADPAPPSSAAGLPAPRAGAAETSGGGPDRPGPPDREEAVRP